MKAQNIVHLNINYLDKNNNKIKQKNSKKKMENLALGRKLGWWVIMVGRRVVCLELFNWEFFIENAKKNNW